MENDPKPVPQANWQRTLFLALMLFTLGVAVVALAGEILKTRLIWYFRVTDFVDFTLNMPLYIISLVLFVELSYEGKTSRQFRIILLVFSFLFIYGNAMRTSTNAINTLATEIRDYTNLPPDMYALLYFLDETLGHIIIDLAQFLLFGCLLYLEVRYLASPSIVRRQPWPLVAGILYGLMEAVNFIEGQKALLAPLVILGLGAMWLWLWRQSGERLRNFARSGPATAFFANLLIFFPCGMGIYWISFGSFIEPSKLTITPANFIPLGIFMCFVMVAAAVILRLRK